MIMHSLTCVAKGLARFHKRAFLLVNALAAELVTFFYVYLVQYSLWIYLARDQIARGLFFDF